MNPTGPGQAAKLLVLVAATFDKAKVPYAVVGALAASYHGVVRASLDADAVLFVRPQVLSDHGLINQWSRAGLRVEERKGGQDDPIPFIFTVTDQFNNRVDLLFGLQGMDARAFGRTSQTSLMGQPIRIIGLEDFIAMKIYAGSARDLEDARNAIAVSHEKVDVPLLEKLLKRQGKSALRILKSLLPVL